MRSAIVARVCARNPMEVADDLGHRFWRLLPYGRRLRSSSGRSTLKAYSEIQRSGQPLRNPHHLLATGDLESFTHGEARLTARFAPRARQGNMLRMSRRSELRRVH